MKYKWLLFDADNTLFDFDQAETKALEKTFWHTGHAFDINFIDIYRRINKQIWQEFERGEIKQSELKVKRFAMFLEAIGLETDSDAFSQNYLHHLSRASDLIEGADTLLAALARQVEMLIITNGLKEVQRPRLAQSGLEHYFADIIISEEVGSAKPDRRIFDVAFEKMNHPAKEAVLIIGDSLTSDIQGGHDYGIDTCWFNPAEKCCDLDIEIRYEIRHLAGVLDII